MTHEELQAVADELASVAGVVAVSLGGSRARGEHRPDSDFDLGIYYRRHLDVSGLSALARRVAGPEAKVGEPGDWGPWVDGGAWLSINGANVDWIYRDLDRVQRAWKDAQAGRFSFHGQVGHPHGVPDFAYVGEVALAVVLSDGSGELTKLRDDAQHYPPLLRDAVVRRLDEATFLIAGASKAVSVGDAAYVAGCAFRVVGLCAHALHAAAGRWLINEKGSVASAGRLPLAPPGFGARAHGVLGEVGTAPEELAATLLRASELVRDAAASCTLRSQD